MSFFIGEETSLSKQVKLKTSRFSHRTEAIHLLCCGVSIVALFNNPQIARADDSNQLKSASETETSVRIHQIDRSLVLQFIKLARFNIQFHQEANRHQKWRLLTYPLFREGGTAVSLAASLEDLKQRVRGLDDPSRISTNALRNIVSTTVVGNTISGSASALELAQNTYMMLRAQKQGYSPKESVAFVKEIVETTDGLLSERDGLLATIPDSRTRRIDELQGLLLGRIRQQLLSEFRTWSSHSRDRAWRENTFYAIDASQNFTRMSAGIIGLKAFRKPNLGGGAAIVTLASNGAATVSPLVSNLVGYLVRKYQSRKLSREFPPDPRVKPLDESLKELALIKELQKDDATLQHSQLLAEATLLSDRSQHLDVVLDRESRDIERFRKVAQQQSISGPLIGLTGVAGSILGTIAFYDFRKNRDTTNKLLFSGRIPGIAGQSYALANTPCTIIAGIQRNRKLKIAGELPSEVLAERLRKMDALEKRIKSTSP